MFNLRFFRLPLVVLFASWVCGVFAQTPQFVNASFESPVVGWGVAQSAPTGAGWTFNYASGISGQGTWVNGYNSAPPEGQQIAYLTTFGSIEQTVTLPPGVYHLSYRAAVSYDSYNTYGGVEVYKINTTSTLLHSTSFTGWSTPNYSTFTTMQFTVHANGPQTFRFRNPGGRVLLDDIRIVAAVNPPAVQITSPANSALLAPGSNLPVSANASDDGSIQAVQFYNGASPVGPLLTQPPYSWIWSSIPQGNYALMAEAVDNQGNVTTSPVVNFSANVLPTVAITAPTAGQVFNAPANVVIAASAFDNQGSISKVEFFRDGVLIGTSTSAPFQFNWNLVPVGNYNLTAVATDGLGATVTSAPINISVVQGPIGFINGGFESPVVGDGTMQLVPTATSQWQGTYGGVYTLGNYFVSNGYLMNPYPAPQGVQVASLPSGQISQTISLPAGQYSVRLKAAYPFYYYWGYSSKLTVTRNGQTVLETPWLSDANRPFATFNSSLFTVASTGNQTFGFRSEGMAGVYVDDVEIVVGNLAPAVNLQVAPNLATLSAPATVTLQATANDPEGSAITSVQYFANGVAIGAPVSAPPYQLDWLFSTPGNYAITAQATDNLGAVGISATRNLTITAGNQPPTTSVAFFRLVGNPTTLPPNLPGATSGYSLYPSLATYEFHATAADSDGTVQAVRFLVNGVPLVPASVTQGSTFTSVIPFYEAGIFEIRAQAQDNQGVWGAPSANGFLFTVGPLWQGLPPLIEVNSEDASGNPILNWTWTPSSNVSIPNGPLDYLHTAVEQRTLTEIGPNAIGQEIVFTLGADTSQQFGYITGLSPVGNAMTTDHLVVGLNYRLIRNTAGDPTGNEFVGFVAGAVSCNSLDNPTGSGNGHGIGLEFQPGADAVFTRYVKCFAPGALAQLSNATSALFQLIVTKPTPGSTRPIAELKVLSASTPETGVPTLTITESDINIWKNMSVHPTAPGGGVAGPFEYPGHAGSAIGGLRAHVVGDPPQPAPPPAIGFKARVNKHSQSLIYGP